MLFNSVVFIVYFLPLSLLCFFIFARFRARYLPITWIIVASLFFYSWWDYHNLFIIIPSIFGNYFLGGEIGRARRPTTTSRRSFSP
jgi:alginate O-acetyltransferase complex protein AlgI